jgi:hypothetical protein
VQRPRIEKEEAGLMNRCCDTVITRVIGTAIKFGDIPATAITTGDIDAFMDARRAGSVPSNLEGPDLVMDRRSLPYLCLHLPARCRVGSL